MAIKYYSQGELSSTKHVGCVIDRETRDYRAMSDVYTTADYACVWIPETESVEWKLVNVNYMGCDSHGVIERDITTGQYAEDYEIYLMIQEDIKRENERIEAERRAKKAELGFKKALQSASKGATCRAIKGRKVPKGTEGVIFYIRHDRIGFKDANGVAWWINGDQIEVMYKAWDFEPADSWKDEYQRASATWSQAQQYANGQRSGLRY
tara:strand:- start:78 stop:704 length:627 start_codon:yes stop_codon:yes gene_type:complete